MTGAEHYAEAERFLSQSEDEYIGSAEHTGCLRRARVHATLAAAAATIDAAYGQMSIPSDEAWRAVLRPADAGAEE